jgi:hypothetical protein
MSDENTNKVHSKDPDLLVEYDFRGGVRGKYAARFGKGTNLVLLDPDVSRVFPDAESVNDALRAMAQIIERHGQRTAPRRRTKVSG